ncbi:MAG: tetratricopeptide repeat protein [Duncaniella sp.]|nr:tetratricopeptide repeat protein [Duncaniella sp.]
MEKLQNIENIIASGDLSRAVEALTEMIDNGSDGLDDLYFRRGKLYWRLGRRSEATSDYMKAVALNPDSPAARALENARDIEAFFNPDLYNP